MHEFHAVEGLVKQVLEKAKAANAASVTCVNIVMGELVGFDEGSIRLYFEDLTNGTIAEGAKVVFKHVKAAFKCKECSTSFQQAKKEFSCPSCCSMQLLVTSGREFYVDSIEIDSPQRQ